MSYAEDYADYEGEAEAIEDHYNSLMGMPRTISQNIWEDKSVRCSKSSENTLQMIPIYKRNKSAPVGDSLLCPTCKTKFIKTTYQKVFCSNQKTNKTAFASCKDRFWNALKIADIKM